jgi:hypothetical protein
MMNGNGATMKSMSNAEGGRIGIMSREMVGELLVLQTPAILCHQ